MLHPEYGTDPSVYYIDYKLGGNDNKAPVEAQTGSHIQHLSTVYEPQQAEARQERTARKDKSSSGGTTHEC